MVAVVEAERPVRRPYDPSATCPWATFGPFRADESDGTPRHVMFYVDPPKVKVRPMNRHERRAHAVKVRKEQGR